MGHYTGHLFELLLEAYQNAAARIAAPLAALPRPGQYLQAHDPTNPLAVLPVQLLLAGAQPSQIRGEGVEFAVAGPLPVNWQTGARLQLRGPLGRGFTVPRGARRLALASSGRNPARLLPLLAVAPGAAATVFCDMPPGELPSAIEVQPLAALPAALGWADYVAIDVEPERTEDLPILLGIRENVPATLRGQALVTPPMPCGGLAQCGVCTLSTARGPRLACEDGPVFDLNLFL